MSELFPVESVSMDSPRLAWMKKHEARTHRSPHCPELPWCAWLARNEKRGLPENPEACGYGQTEDEALSDLAIGYNLKLWNEE